VKEMGWWWNERLSWCYSELQKLWQRLAQVRAVDTWNWLRVLLNLRARIFIHTDIAHTHKRKRKNLHNQIERDRFSRNRNDDRLFPVIIELTELCVFQIFLTMGFGYVLSFCWFWGRVFLFQLNRIFPV
jgi:hypothetical protein